MIATSPSDRAITPPARSELHPLTEWTWRELNPRFCAMVRNRLRGVVALRPTDVLHGADRFLCQHSTTCSLRKQETVTLSEISLHRETFRFRSLTLPFVSVLLDAKAARPPHCLRLRESEWKQRTAPIPRRNQPFRFRPECHR